MYRKLSVLLLLLLLPAPLPTGARPGPAVLHAQASPPSSTAAVPPSATPRLLIRTGDLLRVQVWPDPEGVYSGDFLVEETGLVHVPVLGAVMVGGRELDLVRTELRSRYTQVNANTVVAVTPLFSVSVMGAVSSPGMYPLRPGQTVFDAISLAGGFADGARTGDIRLLRGGTVLAINARDVFSTGASDLSQPVQSGDRIHVPQRRSISLLTVLSLTQTAVLLYSLIKGL